MREEDRLIPAKVKKMNQYGNAEGNARQQKKRIDKAHLTNINDFRLNGFLNSGPGNTSLPPFKFRFSFFQKCSYPFFEIMAHARLYLYLFFAFQLLLQRMAVAGIEQALGKP